jgi:hypothetical protein
MILFGNLVYFIRTPWNIRWEVRWSWNKDNPDSSPEKAWVFQFCRRKGDPSYSTILTWTWNCIGGTGFQLEWQRQLQQAFRGGYEWSVEILQGFLICQSDYSSGEPVIQALCLTASIMYSCLRWLDFLVCSRWFLDLDFALPIFMLPTVSVDTFFSYKLIFRLVCFVNYL